MASTDQYLEIIRPLRRRSRIRLALFDFDGTLSLIRRGWQETMASVIVETLLATAGGQDEATLTAFADDLVRRTTGQPTLRQMSALAEAVRARGGRAQPPEIYKERYLQRLAKIIEDRLAGLAADEASAETLMVPGARAILSALSARGVICALASGTDYSAISREGTLLGLTPYFAGGIYGPRDGQPFSKGEVLARLQREYNVSGSEVAVFGDGVVEIEEASRAGAIAIGVASDEARRQGIDNQKRSLLVAAGASIIVPDFSQVEHLVSYLFGTENDLPTL